MFSHYSEVFVQGNDPKLIYTMIWQLSLLFQGWDNITRRMTSPLWRVTSGDQSNINMRGLFTWHNHVYYKKYEAMMFAKVVKCVLALSNSVAVVDIYQKHLQTAAIMMTSSNGNIFRVTGHLCGEFIGPRWIPCTKASDVELWCFLCSAPE